MPGTAVLSTLLGFLLLQALMRGEWRSAYDFLAGLSSWSLVPAKDALLAMLRSKLQQEVLPRTLSPLLQWTTRRVFV